MSQGMDIEFQFEMIKECMLKAIIAHILRRKFHILLSISRAFLEGIDDHVFWSSSSAAAADMRSKADIILIPILWLQYVLMLFDI